MSANLKPYSLDLLTTIALLSLAAAWLRDPRRRWLALLAALAPLAIGLSYPSVFVAGGVSLTLLPALWRRRVVSEWVLFAIFNVLLLTAFLACLLLVSQPRPGAPDLRQFMADYWRDGFPPAEWWKVPLWLTSAHAGLMFAYPVGAERGGSALTLFLFAVGAAWCWRQRPRWQLGLCLAPFALHLLAALLHRYPYGVSARLAQHLAPAICLLAGAGLARLLEARPRGLVVAVGLLVLCGAGGMAADFVRPYRDPLARWSRELYRDMAPRVADGERLTVMQPPEDVAPTLRWHLQRLGPGVEWGGRDEGAWQLDVRADDGGAPPAEAVILASGKQRWRCALYPPRVASSRASQRRSVASR